MDAKEMLSIPVAQRRGAVTRETGAAAYLLVDAPPDQVLDVLLAKKVIGAARRDCLEMIGKMEVPRPTGSWGVLVRLKGHRWTYVLGDRWESDWAQQWAAENGWRTAWFSFGGSPITKVARHFEGRREVFNFAAGLVGGLMKKEKNFLLRKKVGELESAVIRGDSDVCTQAWLKKIESGGDAIDKLARQLDAYIPVSMGCGSDEGRATVGGWDGEPYPEEEGDSQPLPLEAFERVDVFTYGGAETLEPSAGALALTTALRSGDVEGARRALADGADPNVMADTDDLPLEVVLQQGSPYIGGLTGKGRFSEVPFDRHLALLTLLLEAGAKPDPADRHPAIHWAMHWGSGGEEEKLVAQLRVLLAHRANPNSEGADFPTVGMRPLHVALFKDQWLAVTKLLVKHGANLSLRDRAGKTPREYAEGRITDLGGSLAENPVPAGGPEKGVGLAEVFGGGLLDGDEKQGQAILKKMAKNMMGAYAVQNEKELSHYKVVAAFLADAEKGGGDVSDIDAVAAASTAAYLEEKRRRDAENEARIARSREAQERMIAKYNAQMKKLRDSGELS